MNVLEEYLKNPSAYVKKLSFEHHGKIREIITYSDATRIAYTTEDQKFRSTNALAGAHKRALEKLEALPTSDISYAYKKGVRLLDAVKPHLGNITFLKLDIKGYFEHIDCELLAKKIEAAGVDVPELKYCFFDNRVPIGFITSPKLSDFYLYELDKAAEQYMSNHPGLKYSRYADDFLLSSPNEDFKDVLEFGEFIKNELKKYHLELNEEKTIKAKLGKQTSVRFLGLNIGKDKITLSKWYILKTLNAFKRYHIARYNKQDNVNLLKSIAFGLYNFIEQNSESAKQRFFKKYKNEFKKTFSKELRKEIASGLIKYRLDENGETYTAVFNDETINEQPEVLYMPDEFDGAPVKMVISGYTGTRLEKVKTIKLPRYAKIVRLPFGDLKSLEKNPITDLVDLKDIKAKGDISSYANVQEVGTMSSHWDEWDYDESIYTIKKKNGGYSAERIHNGYWSVDASPRYIRNTSYFVSSSELADQLFYYLVEQVKTNKHKSIVGRKLFVIEGNKIVYSPEISIKSIAALQFFFKEIIWVSTKAIHGADIPVEQFLPEDFVYDEKSDDRFEVDLPFDDETKLRRSLCLDFAIKEGRYTTSHTLLDKTKDESVFFDKSTYDFIPDERIKELLLSSLEDFDENGDESLFVFAYQGKKYYAKQIKTSLYHLLQYISPIEFKLPDDYLINDGVGEYLFAGCGDNEILPNAYQGVNSVRVVRISDELCGRSGIYDGKIGIGDYAFKDCKNLEKVYISSAFYAYRNEDRLAFGKGIFDGCDKLNGSIILFPGDDNYYVYIDENGRVQKVKPIKIEIMTVDEINKLDDLGEHATIEVSCPHTIRHPVEEAIKNRKNIVHWMLRHDVRRKPEAQFKPFICKYDIKPITDPRCFDANGVPLCDKCERTNDQHKSENNDSEEPLLDKDDLPF